MDSGQWTYFCSFPCPFLLQRRTFRVSDLCVPAGFRVAVISRDSGRLERLQALVSPPTRDALTTLVGNVGELSWEQKLCSRLSAGWCYGREDQLETEEKVKVARVFTLKVKVRL